jgi:hypothetical protein
MGDDVDHLIAMARSGDTLRLMRAAGRMPGHLDCWDCNCHGFVNGVDWCRDPATWSPAMAARAADLRSGAYARRLRAGLPEWPDDLLDAPSAADAPR